MERSYKKARRYDAARWVSKIFALYVLLVAGFLVLLILNSVISGEPLIW